MYIIRITLNNRICIRRLDIIDLFVHTYDFMRYFNDEYDNSILSKLNTR